LVRVSLWVPCWTNLRLIKVILVASTLTCVYPDLSSFTRSGVYLDLSSFIGSGVIQNSKACIKRSAHSQVHIIWYQSFGSWWHLIKFGESFSLSSLLNQSQTYQSNPCGVYPDLFSFTGSGTLTYLPSLEVASTLTYLPSLEVASTLTYLPSLEVASSKTLKPVSSDPLLVRFTSVR